MNQDLTAGKTVGIVKSPGNKKLIELLEAQGKNTVLFPLIETRKRELSGDELALLGRVQAYDWIVFSDIFTAEYFFEFLEHRNADLFELDRVRVCSLGEAVADRLRFRQIHSDVIPAKIDGRSVFEAIADYIHDPEEIGKRKVLLMRGADPQTKLKKILRENFAQADEIEIYEIKRRDKFDETRLKTLTVGGAIDEILFNSPEDVLSLSRIFARHDLRNVLANSEVRALNEITRQTLSELDVQTKS